MYLKIQQVLIYKFSDKPERMEVKGYMSQIFICCKILSHYYFQWSCAKFYPGKELGL